MARLRDLAKLIRSKNAGPFELTFDIIFDDRDKYRRVKSSGAINRDLFAKLYGVPRERVRLFEYDAGLALKITIPRPAISGALDDTDVYGGQQFGPLVDLDIET